MTRKDFYVYRLIDPRTGEPFYIGKGRGSRCYIHERNWLNGREKNPYKAMVFNQISDAGLRVIVEKIATGLTESDAFARERLEIERIGIDGLTNITKGESPPERLEARARELLQRMKPIGDLPEYLHALHKSMTKMLTDVIEDRVVYHVATERDENGNQKVKKINGKEVSQHQARAILSGVYC